MIQVLTPREVPLGGPRAMKVRRTLPHKDRSLIGAWCFADHYGPERSRMDVAPHPHTGLQTVSWLFSGEIEHRDSVGSHAMVRPGELNLMTAGHGISHSEVSTPQTDILHGMQLWVALPAVSRFVAPTFEHYVPEPVSAPGLAARVFLGTVLGETSPVSTYTPLLGAEMVLDAGARVTLEVDPTFEHGIIVDRGSLTLADADLSAAELGYVEPGEHELHLHNSTQEPVRFLLLGGPPFGEQIVMWWNFVGRSHEDVVEYRAAYEAENGQFGTVEGYPGPRLHAPELPNARMKPRG
ncbi:pirin family protein [Rhodococcoides fascians A21d2]|uniref:pirin family protein n=1 Tax=Rhodococcoides fascians TaxID=1828 RepID=UPI00055CAFD8|nr:pirin family protein [Rhodococcus fascians]QIH99172.1 pirin family protein [Rhodococcus fascians A21d2]